MKLHTLIICVTFLTMIAGAHAAKYIQPNESKELFKVEKIPLQVDSMKELSRHLTALARRNQDASPAQRRGTAQLLALAMRLNSANQRARETDQAMRKNETLPSPQEESILKAKARLRFFQRWLATPDAGADANTLALYITDATRILREETLNDSDQADWAGVLPPLDKYQEPKQTAKKADPAPATPSTPDKPTIENPYKISKLTVMMPLTMDTVTKTKDPNNNSKEIWNRESKQVIYPVELTITPQQQPLSISITSPLGPGNANNDAGGLRKALELLQTRLNSSSSNGGAKAALKAGTGAQNSSIQYSSKNGYAAAAAVELMLAASKAGKPLREDIHLCATLSSKGELRLPKNFWEVLKAMRKDDGKSGRLIVPKAAIEPLIELLVFDEADFFTRWEVIGVDHIDQALTYAVADSNSDITKAGELFLSIRELTKKEAVTKIAINKVVRTRLSEIESLAPEHLSAKTLLLQGSGKRPLHLSQLGTAYQIQSTVKAMQASLATINVDHPNSTTLKRVHEQARADLDPILKLINTREDTLYQETLKLANELRSLYTLARRNSRSNSNSNTARAKTMATSIKSRATKHEAAIDLMLRKAR